MVEELQETEDEILRYIQEKEFPEAQILQSAFTTGACERSVNGLMKKAGASVSKLNPRIENVWFQKISIPLPRMVLPIRPPHPLGISVPEGSCITPHPPGISYFPFHGLYLPHLEIIESVPLKINCSHLKTQFFIIFDLFVIFYKEICILTQVEHA